MTVLENLKTNFEKLKAGMLLRDLERESAEPENAAMDQVSKELRFLQRQTEYVSEIERVMKELRLTLALIRQCRDADTPHDVSMQELLAYYQGVFLALVHQMKDRVTLLVDLMTEVKVPVNPTREKDVSVSKLLKKKQEKIKEIGIEDQIAQWDQENSESDIAVALRKRTHHHHRISGLRYDQDYLNLGFADIMSKPEFQETTTEYGKQEIEKMRQESTDRLFAGAAEKAENTLKVVENNLEDVSGALIEYFKLPTSQEELTAIGAAHGKALESLKVVNVSSMENAPEPQKTMVLELAKKMKESYGDLVTAVYLVGSLGRGDYDEEYSDINVYVVLDDDDPEGQLSRDDFGLALRAFSKEIFMSDECRKFRLIAKTDGILLTGEDLVQNENVPKAGMLLALALYDDILEILDGGMEWIEQHPGATRAEIANKSSWLAKRIIDFVYAAAMTNRPSFTASRVERVEHILRVFPGNDSIINLLMDVSRQGVGELESLRNMIEGARPKAEENLEQMLAVKKELKEE